MVEAAAADRPGEQGDAGLTRPPGSAQASAGILDVPANPGTQGAIEIHDRAWGYIRAERQPPLGPGPIRRISHHLWSAMNGNAIQSSFDAFMASEGFRKRSGSWYRRSNDVITVVELQKSQYGPTYYINVAVWLLALGDVKNPPKERTCHVRTRLSRLVGTREDRLAYLLDLDTDLPDEDRKAELTGFLGTELTPILEVVDSLHGLRSAEGRRVVGAALVLGAADHLLASPE